MKSTRGWIQVRVAFGPPWVKCAGLSDASMSPREPAESKRDVTIRYAMGTVMVVLPFQCIWKSFTQVETVS